MSFRTMRIRISLFETALVFAAFCLAGPAFAQTQFPTAGLNGVYTSATVTTPSQAYIDASVFTSSGDVCTAIQTALLSLVNNFPTASIGTVDARGITPGSGSASCGVVPWDKPTGALTQWPPYAVVLLPAGTISMTAPWVLPQQTRLIGVGPGATILQRGSSFSGADMIEMGSPVGTLNKANWCGNGQTTGPTNCLSIAIEHLGLDGTGATGLNGIVNMLAQELSFVNDVAIKGITGTGLTITEDTTSAHLYTAANSGPYTNITFAGSGSSAICVSILGSFADTRGIHGLHCTSQNQTQSTMAAVAVDSSNNSIEDVFIDYFATGIQVGNNSAAQNTLLMNISGGSHVRDLVDISPNNSQTTGHPPIFVSNCPASTVTGTAMDNVCDVTVLAATSAGTDTIKDELTGATVVDPTLAMYILGEQIFQGTTTKIGYSRLTTSSTQSAWYSGSSAPTGSCPVGSIYTCTSTSGCPNAGSGTLWGCVKVTGGGTTWVIIE